MPVSEESSDDENFDHEVLVRDFENEAQLLMNNLLPPKSKDSYLKAYQEFMKWKDANSASFEESVFIVYFEELSKTLKPPTLWSIWSKLKATLNLKERVNLDKYNMLKTCLKNKSKGYKPKKSKILTLDQVNKFLKLTDDNIYLSMKAILIVGFFGALRCQEILNLKTTDIEDTNNQFIIQVNETKTYLSRNFVISREYYDVLKKYILLRPNDMQDNRFFVNYQKGKCLRQFIGKNKISEIPSIVATFLQLPEPEKYTGHCYRRSSATALSNAGGDLIKVKNHGGWKSDNVAQGYIEFSTSNRRQIFDMIADSSKVNHFSKHPPVNNIYPTTSVPKRPFTNITNKSEVSTANTEKEEHTNNLHVPSTSNIQSDADNSDMNNQPEHVQSNGIDLHRIHSKERKSSVEDNSNDQDEHNPSNITAAQDENGRLNEPPLKRIKSNSTNETRNKDLHNPSSALFQNCEVHTVNITNNYYSSKVE